MKKARPGVAVEMQPGGRGDFVVKLDGKTLWDKRRHAETRFPTDDEILRQLPPA